VSGAGTLALAAILALSGCARNSDVRVVNAWVRPVSPGRTTAGYFTLENDSRDTLELVGVEVPAVAMSMMHTTVRVGNELTMEEADRFTVPPHSRLRFAPGGNHVMAMQARRPLAEGDTTGIDLMFAGGRRIHATARVRSR